MMRVNTPVLISSPESAEQSSFGVREGDLILVGTDGLFDNMNEEMILKHLRRIKVGLEALWKLSLIGHVTLVDFTGTTILLPYF